MGDARALSLQPGDHADSITPRSPREPRAASPSHPAEPLAGGWSELMASPAFGLRSPDGGPFAFGGHGGYPSAPSFAFDPPSYGGQPYYDHAPSHTPGYERADMFAASLAYRPLDNAYAGPSRAVYDLPDPLLNPLHESPLASDEEMDSAEPGRRPSTRSGGGQEEDAAEYEDAPAKRKGKRSSVVLSAPSGNSEVRLSCSRRLADPSTEAQGAEPRSAEGVPRAQAGLHPRARGSRPRVRDRVGATTRARRTVRPSTLATTLTRLQTSERACRAAVLDATGDGQLGRQLPASVRYAI